MSSTSTGSAVLTHRTTRLRLAEDMARGMAYLHKRMPAIIHRDLKSPNILLTETPAGGLRAVIGDFGLAVS